MIRLIHRSHGIHEMVLHQLCVDQGLYRSAELEVELVDGTGPQWKEASSAPDAATVAVGGVVADWLRGDRTWQVRFVATSRPLMWVVGSGARDSVADLAGLRIAGPNAAYMPSLFLRLLLQRHGLDIATDVELVEVRNRPDRLGLLLSGDVEASLLGPEGLGLDGDLAPIVYVGAHVEFPTVGLATRPGFDPGVAATLADVLGEGLTRLRADPAAAAAAMIAVEPDIPAGVADRVAREVVPRDWTGPEWAVTGDLGDVVSIAAYLGVTVDDAEGLRRFVHGWASA